MAQQVATIETTQQAQPPRLPSIQAGGAVRAIVPQDFDSAWRIANAVVKAGMSPKGLETAEKAMVAIMHGLEIGLTPMNALQSIAVVNGRPVVWGDGAIGLVRGSGLLEWMDERLDGAVTNDGCTATCTVKRQGEPKPIRGVFSVADAKRAGLWSKTGPWTQYPQRMLQMRARAFALRDGFADVLKGIGIREEVEDFRDVTPRAAAEEPPEPPEEVVATAEPEPKSDMPDPKQQAIQFTEWVDKKLAAATNADEFDSAWELCSGPAQELLPPEYEDVMNIYRKHEERLAP